MTNPYSVPVEDLEAVHVPGEELVAEHQSSLRWAAAGPLVPPFGDGATGATDGE